jgi:hypothetical protein
MNKNKLEIKRIYLMDFISTLLNMYSNGTDVVNMIVEKGDHQDSIWFEEYTSKDKTETKDKRNVNFEELI